MNAFFAFSGQGAQTVGMGRDLYDAFPAAKAVFDKADQVLGYSLSGICFDGPAEKLTETRYCQTAIYTMSCAALAAFREKYPEIKPVACAGLSLGEYAALFAANAFSFEDGLQLLRQRAEFMDEACKAAPGGMASVLGGDADVIAEVCAACGIDVANYNSPGQIVISGAADGVKAACAELANRGFRKVIPLTVAGAFHSRMMQSAGDKLAAVLADTPMTMPEVPVFQNFTGNTAADVAELRDNLAKQVAGSVRWETCVRNAAALGADTIIEFGPGAVLTGLMRRTIPEMNKVNINGKDFEL
ncbi:MAG: ACP S-malonyltransferase [Lentisphaeria bacterium]|nr:ACP S-malonyltransferase [Lentisphaeria bacterium]